MTDHSSPMTAFPLLIRADASPEMGSGHIMRCLALAQAWQDQGGSVTFALAADQDAGALVDRLQSEGMSVVRLLKAAGSDQNAHETAALAQQMCAQWLVLDGYHFSADYQKRIKASGLCLLVLDDNHEQKHYYADLILNQNIHAREDLYPAATCETGTDLLLGTRYSLLRREFREAAKEIKRTVPDKARKLLITLGGADSANVTTIVLQAVKSLQDQELELRVLLGANNRHAQDVRDAAAGLQGTVKVLTNVPNVAEQIRWADLAISAAGSTIWELCALGCPTLAIVTAENQQQLAQETERQNCIELLDAADTKRMAHRISAWIGGKEKRAQAHMAMQRICDAKGAGRICTALQTHGMRLRPVQSKDAQLLFTWANDPLTRANGFNPEAIAWDEHVAWLQRQLKVQPLLFWIAEDGSGDPVGQFRLATDEEAAEISIGICPMRRGQGWGGAVLKAGIEAAQKTGTIKRLLASIVPENSASQAIFRAAGFQLRRESLRNNRCSLNFEMALGGSTLCK